MRTFRDGTKRKGRLGRKIGYWIFKPNGEVFPTDDRGSFRTYEYKRTKRSAFAFADQLFEQLGAGVVVERTVMTNKGRFVVDTWTYH